MNKRTGRLDAVKATLARFRFDATFTSIDLARLIAGHTATDIARDLIALANKGEIELVGKQKRDGGGQDIKVYQRVKKVTFAFEAGLAGGVWSDLYMRPLPITQKGRVHVCHG